MKSLEIGVFMPIAKNGFVRSVNAPPYYPSYEELLAITQLTEAIGLDYAFAMSKWSGFGGATKFWGVSFESFSLMAALAAKTERIALIATVNPLLFHPTPMAKMAATIDDVSGGRLGLNVITGATIGEYAQMGVLPEGYDQKRYDYASEWIHVLKRLWSEPSVTHHGEYFHLQDCVSEPKPKQRPNPFLVCAGASDEGLRFTARETDYAFIGGKDVPDIGKTAQRAKAIAEEERTSIKTATLVTLAIGDTRADAEAYWDHLVAGADIEMLENASRALSAQSRGSAQAQSAVRRTKIHTGHLIVGPAADVAEGLCDFVTETDVDSIVLVFADYLDGLRRFGEGVMPRLREVFDLGVQGARMPNRG